MTQKSVPKSLLAACASKKKWREYWRWKEEKEEAGKLDPGAVAETLFIKNLIAFTKGNRKLL